MKKAALAKSASTPQSLLTALALIRNASEPRPESLDSMEMTHVKRVRRVFDDPNIVGIGIAEKVTERKDTGHLSLCFYVKQKRSAGKVAAKSMIPPVISVDDRTAVFTDVVEIGTIRPQINEQSAPIASGYSISSADTGTLGAIVKKGNAYYVLSNSHVLAKSGRGKKGDAIYYPGKADIEGSKPNKIAKLSDISPFQKSDDFVNRVDAALAKIDESLKSQLDFDIYKAKTPFDTIAPVRGMKVVLNGRTSGHSEGVVRDIHYSTVLTYPGVGKIGFIDQVLCDRYTQGGDSGSIVVDKASGKIVGLHFAGSEKGSLFNPIGEVVKSLKFKFAKS